MKRNTRLHDAALAGLAASGLALVTGGFSYFALGRTGHLAQPEHQQ